MFLVGGIPTPLKNDGVKVSWDDDSSQYDGKSQNSMVPNHQPGSMFFLCMFMYPLVIEHSHGKWLIEIDDFPS